MAPQLLNAVTRVVEQVGAYQRNAFRQLAPGGGDAKQGREFVSEVDLRSEQQLIDGLRPLLPEAGIFGEESGRQGDQSCVWIIDPLDGTTNFLSGLDQFSISVALQVAGRIELGVVFKPYTGECFRGWRGGAFEHNRQPRPKAPTMLLQDALLGTGFPYRSPDLAPAFFNCAADLLPRGRGIRRMGSAALDLSYVAAGFLQGFWESDLQPYDVAAALLFLELSGCRVSNAEGEPYRMGDDRLLVCGCPGVFEALQPIVARHYAGTNTKADVAAG